MRLYVYLAHSIIKGSSLIVIQRITSSPSHPFEVVCSNQANVETMFFFMQVGVLIVFLHKYTKEQHALEILAQGDPYTSHDYTEYISKR